MPRRGENIRKRKDGRWEARYPNGVNEKGATKYTSIYGSTYREVKHKRNLAVQGQALLTIQQKEYPLFKDVLYLWIEDNKVNGTTNVYNEVFEKVTVSQNQLVIFYANTPLFIGTIAGAVALISIIILLVKRKKVKKEEK